MKIKLFQLRPPPLKMTVNTLNPHRMDLQPSFQDKTQTRPNHPDEHPPPLHDRLTKTCSFTLSPDKDTKPGQGVGVVSGTGRRRKDSEGLWKERWIKFS